MGLPSPQEELAVLRLGAPLVLAAGTRTSGWSPSANRSSPRTLTPPVSTMTPNPEPPLTCRRLAFTLPDGGLCVTMRLAKAAGRSGKTESRSGVGTPPVYVSIS